MINFDAWNYYVWDCQEFAPILTEEEGSIIKDAEIYINDLLIAFRNNVKMPARSAKIKEKIKICTEAEIEKDAQSFHKVLMRIVDINLMRDQMSKSLMKRRNITDPPWFFENILGGGSENTVMFG